MEDFVGKPYVYTVDIGNETEVREALTEIKKSKVIRRLLLYTQLDDVVIQTKIADLVIFPLYIDISIRNLVFGRVFFL